MRWRFSDPNSRSEAETKKQCIAKIDAWWRAFANQAKQIDALFSGTAQWDLADWMATHFSAIHPRLMWEFGPGVKGTGHRLVITPEADHYLRPLTAAVLERAPQLPGWEFYAYRLPENLEATYLRVEGRTGHAVNDWKVRAARGNFHRINLEYFWPPHSELSADQAFEIAFVITETLLGEQRLNESIGGIEACSLSNENLAASPRTNGGAAQHLLGLDRLRDTVDALSESIREQLPPRPHYEWIDEAEHTMWKLQPETAMDYPEQQDLFVGKSGNPDMWIAAHSEPVFHSSRFSRCGETFCYLKLDGSEDLGSERFADKAEIEDALNSILIPAKVGCTIGGGTGQRYSYLDLALTDLERAFQAIREVLRHGNISKRSWIQFFDADLASEWIGIYDDTPAPLMRTVNEL